MREPSATPVYPVHSSHIYTSYTLERTRAHGFVSTPGVNEVTVLQHIYCLIHTATVTWE